MPTEQYHRRSWLGRMRDRLSGPESYDLTGLKQIERTPNIEVLVRFGLSILLSTAFAIVFEEPVLYLWAAVFLCSQLALFALMRRMPQNVGRRTVWMLGAVMFVVRLIAMLMPMYIWSLDDTVGRIIGAVFLNGAMLNAMSSRASEPILAVINILSVGFVIAFYAAEIVWSVGMSATTFAVVLSLLASFCYFLFFLKDAMRVRAELSNARRVEVDRARLEAVGRLAGGVAHDFNNLLTVIIGNLQLRREIQRDGGSYLETEALIREVEEAAARAARTTAQLLAYSRKAHLVPARVSLLQAIRNMEDILRRPLPAPVSLDLHLPPRVPDVIVDLAQFENVVLNLILNARDAMPDGGTIRIRLVTARAEDVAELVEDPLPEVDAYVCLHVEDTGTGIPPDLLPKVTEPFFTTKRVGEGSGLGLSMAAGFARQSHGGLSIRSVSGQGTLISLILPACTTQDCPRLR